MIVLDTSAAIQALGGVDVDPDLLDRLETAGSMHAPHLIDAEVLSALRRLVLGGQLSDDRATDMRRDFARLRLVRYPLAGLADRVWSLGHSHSAYDACFVALAEALRCPLVTCDARLARSAGHDAEVELH